MSDIIIVYGLVVRSFPMSGLDIMHARFQLQASKQLFLSDTFRDAITLHPFDKAPSVVVKQRTSSGQRENFLGCISVFCTSA